MTSIFSGLHNVVRGVFGRAAGVWRRYRRLRKPYQIIIGALVIGAVVFGLNALRGGSQVEQVSAGRTVTLVSVGELSNTEGTVNLYGTVRSVTEAKILAQSGGVVRAVHTTIGSRVSAGAIIAELENASERAAVLSAEGAYEAAVAAQSATSPTDVKTTALNAYKSGYNTLDTVLQAYVDLFFGEATPYGPQLLISAPMYDYGELSTERREIGDAVEAYQRSLATADSTNPATLLASASTVAQETYAFLNRLATAANDSNSAATAEQLAALSTARTSINTLLATLVGAQEAYRAGSVTTTSTTEAGVKQALGALRSAQAALERTMVRAPIAGQINFLSIRVGDYVTNLQHVTTVAQNGSLEVVAYVSEDNRNLLVAGGKVEVEGAYDGVITSVSPALDPTTKQIEVRMAVTGTNDLVNGQSVTISLPGAPVAETPVDAGPLLLPLSAVKLRLGDRVVFTVDEESRLVAHTVEVGEVRGDRIEIRSSLDRTMLIVSDARGLAEGEAVKVAAQADTSAPDLPEAL